jgi:hypothetical protein
LFDLPSEPEHLPNIVSDLIERCDDLSRVPRTLGSPVVAW